VFQGKEGAFLGDRRRGQKAAVCLNDSENYVEMVNA